MAKQIIVLRVVAGPGGDNNVSALGWYAVASGHEVPISGAESRWTGASAGENAAISAGSVIEESYAIQYPVTTTKAQIEADLLTRFNTRQAQITALRNPNQFYGIFYDPALSGWSA